MAYPQFDTLPRLLIVDDESANRDLLQRILSRDYEIETAENGAIALEMLYQKRFDVVLLDMMMPVLGGIETLAEIRANADLAELPVIIVSAISESRQIVDAIQLGANDYITKPLDISIVKARVENQVLLKRMMDERCDAVAALQSANRMKAQMMQVASHDLKNPLNNLKMMLTLMKESVGDNPQVKSLMNIADESIGSMVDIIDDFLSTAAVDNNGIAIHLAPVESKEVLQQTLEQYALAARNKQIVVSTEGDFACVQADGRRLVQVLGNLVSNAIKYSPSNSRVTVRSSIKGDTWRLEVEDSGAGIPEKERRHLFTPFSKNMISTQPTNGESSTGLGLWIAAEMMRLQNGAIGMTPSAQGSSIFWLELTLAPEKQYAYAV